MVILRSTNLVISTLAKVPTGAILTTVIPLSQTERAISLNMIGLPKTSNARRIPSFVMKLPYFVIIL